MIHAKRALMASPDASREKFKLLDEIGEIYQDKLQNPQKAIAAYLEALELEPNDHQLLHKVLDLYTETKQWKKAVEIITSSPSSRTESRKGSYQVRGRQHRHYELKSTDEAVEIYNQALDEDPGRSEGVRAHRQDLTAQEGLEEPGAQLPQDDQAPGSEPAAERQDEQVALWHALGEIYRSRLKDFKSAIAAFEVACSSIRTRRRATRSSPSSIRSRGPTPTTRRSTSTATSSR